MEETNVKRGEMIENALKKPKENANSFHDVIDGAVPPISFVTLLSKHSLLKPSVSVTTA